jgi:hypothetical protein
MGSRLACALLRPPDDYGCKWWIFSFLWNAFPQLFLGGGRCRAGPLGISGTFKTRVLTRLCPFPVVPALLLASLLGVFWMAFGFSGMVNRFISQSMVTYFLTSTAWVQVNGMLVAQLSSDLPRFLIWLLAEECQWWLLQLWLLLRFSLFGATATKSLIFCGTLSPGFAQVLELVGGGHPVMQWIWFQHIMVYLVQRLSVSLLLWHDYSSFAQVKKLMGGRHPIMW